MITKIAGAYSVYNAPPVKRTNNENTRVKGSSGDSVTFSAVANELNAARMAISELPDVRSARVDQLREQLQSGTYSVSAKTVAAKIFNAYDEN
jgi:negative regulator of flagellin synthesis FlgM